MSERRFFIDQPLTCADGARTLVPLSDEDLHHATKVGRVRPGERVVVVAPDGRSWGIEVTTVGSQGLEGVASLRAPETGPPIDLVVFQGVPKGEKMDLVVRQCVEVGAREIVPVEMARTVVRLDDKKRRTRVERWRKIALAAAKQSGREAVPLVHDVCSVEGALDHIARLDRVFVLWEQCDSVLLSSAVRQTVGAGARSVGIFVGPEGGLDPAEVTKLTQAGCLAVSLGPFILRTETAAVAAAAITIAGALDHVSHP